MDLHQGDCVQLIAGNQLVQVIAIDNQHNRCWVRRWPLMPKGSPVFEVTIKEIASSSVHLKRSVN